MVLTLSDAEIQRMKAALPDLDGDAPAAEGICQMSGSAETWQDEIPSERIRE